VLTVPTDVSRGNARIKNASVLNALRNRAVRRVTFMNTVWKPNTNASAIEQEKQLSEVKLLQASNRTAVSDPDEVLNQFQDEPHSSTER
jgi:hypothetical protein